MKSIMEEASTIFKAIEKAWIRAEKPQSFSVKLLEEPAKNFIGMTTKPAKIAFLFDEVVGAKQVKPQHAQPLPHQEKRAHAPVQQAERPQKKQPQPHQAPQAQQKHTAQQPQPRKQAETLPMAPRVNEQPVAPRENQPLWHEDMARAAEEWLKETLTLLDQQVPPFTTEIKNKHLIIAFEKPIVEDGHQERLLFSSLAHLVLQVVRNKFKNQARGLKIILKTNS